MFGFTIISNKELAALNLNQIKMQKFLMVHRWFAGWKDLDIIWDYLIEDTNYGGIERARKDYAEARKTDEYGSEIK